MKTEKYCGGMKDKPLKKAPKATTKKNEKPSKKK